MLDNRRAVSTVADVTLGLLLIVSAMGVLVVFADSTPVDHEPVDTEYTAQTVAASTINTSYTVSTAVDEHYQNHRSDSNPYNESSLERVSHGPIPTEVAAIAVASAAIDGKTVSKGAVEYEAAVDEQLQTRFVGSRFDVSVSAYWTPFEGAAMAGETTLGRQPPPDADVSTTTITVASGLPEARSDAVAAVDSDSDYEAVAGAVANATIAGYFPEFATQQALEGSGVETHLTRYRYNRFGTVLDGDATALEENGWLAASTADAGAANEYLSERLAAKFETQLATLDGDRYQTATEAAQAVSTGVVTITIRTWTHD